MSQIQLSWNAVTPAGSTYTVLRNGVVLVSALATTTYLDAAVADNTAYTYAVFAINANGAGLPSNTAAATTPPGQVTGLSAVPQSASAIALSWTAVAGASTYSVFRGVSLVGTVAGTAFTDTALAANTLYSYTVAANGTGGQGVASVASSATTLPAQVLGLTATTVSTSAINLAWTAQTGIATYPVRRGGVSIATPSSASYADTGLTASTLYSYTVAANNVSGQGAQSAAASATTQASGAQIRSPSGHWIYIDQGVSKDSQFARTQQLVGIMGNDVVGFEYLWKWADLENPNVPGDYSGNWATAGQAGFQLVHRFADYLRSVGKKMHLNNFSYGGNVGAPNSAGTAFLADQMPAYMAGGPSSPYGPNTAATDGINGGLWQNCFPQTWSNVRSFMRFWQPAVAQRMLALSAAYAAEFNTHTGFGMFSPFSESTLPLQMSTYSVAADKAVWFGSGGFFQQMRAQWTEVPLRWWGNFIGVAQDMSDYHTQVVANKWMSAGPDLLNDFSDLNTTNYPAWSAATAYVFSQVVSRGTQNYFCLTANTNSQPPSANWQTLPMGTRNITSDWVWQGKDSNGVVNSNYTNHVGTGAFGFDVEPLDLDQSHDDAVGTTHIAHANRCGGFALFWYDLRYNSSNSTPSRNRTDTPSPNLLDQISSSARGGVNVNGFNIGRLLLDKSYPPTW